MKNESKYFIYDRPIDSIKEQIKYVRDYIEIPFYSLKRLLARVKSTEKKYNVSICAIFKNESVYLKEWIEFHKIIGIDHFYLYNNNSTDNYLEILDPYISSGLVTLIQFPYNQAQLKAYKDCVQKFKGETKWLGFIDIDEFIVPKSTTNIYDFLKQYNDNAGAIKIYWRLYGSSGRLDRNLKGLVTEDFTVCWPKYDEIGKCFYNTDYEIDFESSKNCVFHHITWTKSKVGLMPPINIFNHPCKGHANKANTDDFPIQINHYFTKSYNEYAVKRSKGDVYFKVNPHDIEYFFRHEMKCTSVDYSAYKYLIKLKLAMNK